MLQEILIRHACKQDTTISGSDLKALSDDDDFETPSNRHSKRTRLLKTNRHSKHASPSNVHEIQDDEIEDSDGGGDFKTAPVSIGSNESTSKRGGRNGKRPLKLSRNEGAGRTSSSSSSKLGDSGEDWIEAPNHQFSQQFLANIQRLKAVAMPSSSGSDLEGSPPAT